VEVYEERTWLHDAVESGRFRATLSDEERRRLLRRLTEVEGFERFLHTVFQGQKRFSIEGNDVLVPILDEIVGESVDSGVREVLIGMAHRGRLNVLAHVFQKPYRAIFAEFHLPSTGEHGHPVNTEAADTGWTGDVKYHLGAAHTMQTERGEIHLTLADNPSHLEYVNPVVGGFARAAQDDRRHPGAPTQDVEAALAVTIHGDAAFPGEGVVAETLNLSRLAGYGTGGSIRIIVNNQIGFTTSPEAARSTLYASDLAKGFEIPIVHVNGDDPEACMAAVRLACAYRQRFHKDFLIDIVGYRRWGHNEGDEPTFTQPGLYATIQKHPTVRALYAQQLVDAGIVSSEEAETMQRKIRETLRAERDAMEDESEPQVVQRRMVRFDDVQTAVPAGTLHALSDHLLDRPEGFAPNPKLERILQRRRDALDTDGAIDWAFAESLAFASLLQDGTPIRMSGQDVERGTFSQRHLVLHDPETDASFVPLQHLPEAAASFAIYNSPLTESAVIGFEYGYSVHAPEALVLWEAQFGDFANAGQVLIDQYISAAWAKWRANPSLVLLLPHGYEGQGPEHSSGRLERYLQLAAENNLRIANCTSAAQYFHLLRAQAATLQNDRRPLIVMTPKSLLRHPLAASSLHDLTEGHFQAVRDDTGAAGRKDRVTRLVLCTGKVAIDLTTTARKRPDPVEHVAVARVELLYPFPADQLRAVMESYPALHEVVWLQEEPENMGAWRYMEPRLRAILPDGVPLGYIGRPERASTAEGNPELHEMEQRRIVEAAFDGERVAYIETRGVQHVG
jgi:2-oxoglutarate dehydrogenase E1 component